MNKAYFIITIHNKESLIKQVLEGIIFSTQRSDYEINIICVIDGCSDNTEKIIDDVIISTSEKIKFHKLYRDNVHEILSTQYALDHINTFKKNEEDLIFFLQDDVILQQENITNYIQHLYESVPDLGYISFRLGCFTSLDSNNILCEHTFYESTFGHWKQLNLDHFIEVNHLEFVETEIVIKSPTCIKKKVLDRVGYFDLNLAPYAHDDLDLCIRLNQLGYKNGLFAAKFDSEVDWGGTRQPTEINKNFSDIVFRNKLYLTEKHKDYYSKK